MHRQLRTMGFVFALGACAGGSDAGGAAAGGEGTAAAPDPAAVRATIEAANKRAVDALNAGVPDSMIALYADDAIIMMSGMPAMRLAGFKEMLQQVDVKNFTAKTEDVMVSGDIAVETGANTYEIGPKGGKLAADTAKYIMVWKKQGDGSWKVVRDIFNTDIAPKM